MPEAPATLYEERRAARGALADRLRAREALLSNARLAVFAAGVAAVVAVWGAEVLPAPALAPIAVVFLALAIWHDRVIQSRERADRAVDFYARGLARLDGSWPGGGVSGDAFLDPKHPYAEDLDVFGRGSLFELLCTARTAAGELRLARWLCEGAAPGEVRERQAAVAELRPRLDLREDLALLGEDVRAGVHPELLARWAAEAPVPSLRTWRPLAAGLAAAAVLGFAGWVSTLLGLPGPGAAPFVVALSCGGLLAWRLRGRASHILSAAEQPVRDLALLSHLLERLDRERFESPRLAALAAVFATDGAPAWREIERLRRLLGWADARRNQFFAPFAALLLWGTQLSLAIEAWRQRHGRELAGWLEAVGEIEALVSLASHAFENPADPFPEIVTEAELATERPCFVGEGLGHPLLPASRSVRNDAHLHPGLAVVVVSGSNMSGKSTWLRTVGSNAVLALAGAPVRARRLRLSPLAVGASIRVHDSLQEGESRFYAEIKRLRQIVDLARSEGDTLFLLDEILHGTNSHDRQIGAAAVVRDLVGRGAIGLVTTHDLALARIVDELAPRARNLHFEDHLEDGRIAFDYRLRAGVVEKSNALALMREVGLEV